MIINKHTERRSSYIILSHQEIQKCIGSIFHGSIVKSFKLAKAGLANTNYIVNLSNKRKVVLRIYPGNDNIVQIKEFKISKLLVDFPEIPRIYHAPSLIHNNFAWNAVDFVEGITLAEALHINQEALSKAYFKIGVVLSKLQNIIFSSHGLLNEKLEIQEIKTVTQDFHPVVNFIMDCLNNENFISNAGLDIQNELRNLIIRHDYILHKIEQKNHLVHGDFKIENILVKCTANGDVHLSGVLDWEHARADTVYSDIATLFRGDYNPKSIFKREFIKGYELNHVPLIEEWNKAIKIIDLINLCSFLCSNANRSLFYQSILKHIINTISYFKADLI